MSDECDSMDCSCPDLDRHRAGWREHLKGMPDEKFMDFYQSIISGEEPHDLTDDELRTYFEIVRERDAREEVEALDWPMTIPG